MDNIRILIVEDEPIIAADLADRLIEMGYDIAGQCSSGEEALELTPHARPDLILMDIQLDGALDGIETATRINHKQHIPVIFLTSNSDDATFARAKTTMPAAFLSKPFRGKDLKHAIELAIGQASKIPPLASPPPDTAQTYLFQDRIFIKTKDRLVRTFLHDILWLEADDYYCRLVTPEREILITQTLKQIGETLVEVPGLMRVHRSYIINLAHVEGIGDTSVYIGKKQIPINKTSRNDIIARLQKI